MSTATKVTIGGSEAAAACGLDPHRSRVRLWLEKTGRVPGPDASEAMRWGTRLEAVICDELIERSLPSFSNLSIYAPEDVPAHPFMHGHPDRLFTHGATEEGPGVLEVKTTGAWRSKEWDEGIPAQPLLQVQHYLALTGLRLGMVTCLIGGQKLVVRRCDRDEQLIAHMLRLEEEFVGLVESDTPPAPEAADVEALGLLYPEARAGVVELTETDYADALSYKAERARLKKQEAHCDQLKARLCARLGEYQVGLWEGKPLVRWTEVTTHRLNQGLLKDQLPTVYEQYCDETTGRRFTVA